jgi:lysophospholipase L1-like esterase
MRARRLVRRLAVGAFALTLAGGVLAPPASASTASARHHHSAVLAALGDSYSSGEGNPPFDPAADGCDRSAQAWPLLAAAKLRWKATNLACSGAQTANVVDTPFKGQPPQVAALAALRPRPDVVTITIGGNDAGFANVLGACFSPAIPDCAGIVEAAEVGILTVLPGRLADTYRAVEAAAPKAKLVVVGYPRLVPADQSDVTGCGSALTDAERQALNHAADVLNAVIAVEAWLAGARYVDVSRTLAGHELCTSDSWLVPLTAAGAGHPNLEGQQAIAHRVAPALKRALSSAGPSRLHS